MPQRIELLRPSSLAAVHWQRWSQFQAAEPALDSPYFRPEFTQAVAKVRRDVEVALASRECIACSLELISLVLAQLRLAVPSSSPSQTSSGGAPVARLAPLLSNAAAAMTREGELGPTLSVLRTSVRTQHWFDSLFAEAELDE